MAQDDEPHHLEFLPESRSYCVCCVDMVNSTEITAGLSDRQTRRYYSVFLNRMGTIIKSYGAKVIKTTGDGMLFYMPDTGDCNNELAFCRSLECCIAMLEESHSITELMNAEGMPPMSYRLSADYGTVQIATSNDLFGSTVNICSKINRIARAGGMVIGSDLYRLVRDFKDYHFTEVSTYKIDKKFRYPVYSIQPIRSRAAVTTHIAPAVVNNQSQPRIMLVDDEDDILTTYKIILSHVGYNVDTFSDAERALENFAKVKQYTLVILDIRMPKINGLQLFQRMKTIDSNTKIMFVTALDVIDEIKTILPDPATSVLRKPVEKQEFISKVNSLLSLA